MLANQFKRSTRLIKTVLQGFLLFYGYHGYHHLVNKPNEFDFSQFKDKEKRIVVVGTGMVGLTTAYYLSNHSKNKITIVERN